MGEPKDQLLRIFIGVLIVGWFAGCAYIPFVSQKKEAEEAHLESVSPAGVAPATVEEEPASPRAESRRKGWQKWLFFWWPERSAPPPAAQALNPAGRIFLVNAPANFVLIETPSARQLPVGQQLHTLADGRIIATVKVSSQRNPPFVVADLVEGMPKAGDRVYPVVLSEKETTVAPPASDPARVSAPAVTEAPEAFTVMEDEEIARLKPIEDFPAADR